MVSREQVEELMRKFFPRCPICSSDVGYDVSGVFNNYVQCNSCNAKWQSADFIKGKEIKTLQLWETDEDGRLENLLKKPKPLSFWQSLDMRKLQASEKNTTDIESTPNGMTDEEYEACVDNLGLLEGEEVRLQYVCLRNVISPPSATRAFFLDDGRPKMESKKGLLVFTNDNVVFMQQEGAWSTDYAQALRIPLETISGVVSGGTFIPHIRILVGVSGATEQHEFTTFQSVSKPIQNVRADIERLLKKVRQEKKRLAQEALSKGTMPAMVFCRYCGTRNKAEQTHCTNCRAPLA